MQIKQERVDSLNMLMTQCSLQLYLCLYCNQTRLLLNHVYLFNNYEKDFANSFFTQVHINYSHYQ